MFIFNIIVFLFVIISQLKPSPDLYDVHHKLRVSSSLTLAIIIFHASGPTGPPTAIEVHQLNSTSVFVLWRPPLAEYRNGIILGYYVEFIEVNTTEVNTTEVFDEYTTPDPYLLINNLEPDVIITYTCRVAAYTVGGSGPFSELMMITLNSGSTYISVSINYVQTHRPTYII